ncbi:YihY/virulence factor BrkB family protein [Halogeometricum sp. CBA1124]|uniref:YihY/virulence factor BrkB family protein n=1 Tax=Halogeometricum sp. CBA1124 TaxID=2668071 RepID=UPI00142A040F|nr:YihY family inner membrane protein [Halogeometricum sp. CBA1124]
MSVRIRNQLSVGRSVVSTIQEREVTFLAASISYYTLVSLVPLLTLALVVASFVGGDAFRVYVLGLAQQYLLPSGSDLVSGALEDPTGQGALSVVSLGVTLWGALKLFRGLDIAFSRIYGSEASGLVGQLRDGIVVLASLGAGTLGVAAATVVIGLVDLPFAEIISPVLLLVLLVVAFFPFYYVLPEAGLSPREALPGTLFAAVGWAVLGVVFGIYTATAGASVAGALGAILLLVTWFYFSGILVLTGAVVNAVLAGKVVDGPGDGVSGDRQVQHRRARPTDRTMSVDDAPGSDDAGETDVEPRGAPDIEQLEDRVEELRADLDAFESDVQERTVDRPDVESELKRYVRGRMRQGKARGWGPYLVLLYGTAVTIAAFFLIQDDLLAVVAMLVTYLSTLGLYVLFVVFGVGLGALGVPGRLVDWVRDRRS